ncbi:MAG: rhomboid family intramembrane serine protease [bacterium]|nr:MAG: rhomboid family intramembrane serine protease [bacterium]
MYFFYYIPVGLDSRLHNRQPIVKFLVIVFVTLFFCYRYLPAGRFWNVTNLIFFPSSPSLVTALTYTFLHVGYLHLIGNIVYVYLFGRVVEDRMGPGRFFAIFALSSIAGAYTHLLMLQQLAPELLPSALVGGSGAASGILGAFLVRFYFCRVRIAYWVFCPLQGVNRAGRSYVPVSIALVLWVLFQGVQAVLQYGMGGMQVAYGVHIGGFAVGMVLAFLFGAAGAARAERHLVKARRHYEEANWFAAQCEYINYLELRPDDAAAHAEVARVFRCSSEQGRVRYHYLQAIGICMQKGERGEAEGVLTEAMRAVPDFALPEKQHLDLACGMERSLKFNSAMKAYRNYVGRYPRSDDAPFVLLRIAGMLERRFKRYDEAIACYAVIVDDYPQACWVDFAQHEMDRLGRAQIVLDPEGCDEV